MTTENRYKTFRPSTPQGAITQVLVNNGDTTGHCGIYVSSEQTNKDGTPGLNRLPFAWLAVQARKACQDAKPRVADLHHARNSDAA
jgi:hypothetical protein